MFSYMSGFISDVPLEDNADVYVFLLFPQKYSNHLDKKMFAHNHETGQRFTYKSSTYFNNIGSLFDDFVPFAMPFKARYCRDTGVYLEDPNELTEWIEKNFNIDLRDFLENLSDDNSGHSKIKDDTIIDNDNIFKYMSVGLEHRDFIDNVFNNIIKHDDFKTKFMIPEQFWEFHDIALIQGLMLNSNLYLKHKQHNVTECIMLSDDFLDEKEDMIEIMFQNVAILGAISFFMRRTNKIFKPCNFGTQDIHFEYFDLLYNSQKEVVKNKHKDRDE